MMNDPARAVLWTALQAELLLLSAVLICLYLFETWKLRVTAQQQAEALIRPALELVTHLAQDKMWFENLGSGPALDLRVSRLDRNAVLNWDAADDGSHLPYSFVQAGKSSLDSIGFSPREFGPERNLQVLYSSLSGRSYASVFEFSKPGIAGRTRFIVKGGAPHRLTQPPTPAA
jgi:hypothetical protein